MTQASTSVVEQKIHAFLVDKFPLARKAGVDTNTPLLENGILDSLGILDIVSYIEGEFDITFGDDELVPENFQSLAALSAFVVEKGLSRQ
jgi:acyl carrier protein